MLVAGDDLITLLYLTLQFLDTLAQSFELSKGVGKSADLASSFIATITSSTPAIGTWLFIVTLDPMDATPIACTGDLDALRTGWCRLCTFARGGSSVRLGMRVHDCDIGAGLRQGGDGFMFPF